MRPYRTNLGLSINALGSDGGFREQCVILGVTGGGIESLSVDYGEQIACRGIDEAVALLQFGFGANPNAVVNALSRELARYSRRSPDECSTILSWCGRGIVQW